MPSEIPGYPIMHAPTTRSAQLRNFVAKQLPGAAASPEPASSDASFRSYWRVRSRDRTRIVMDAPPDLEDVRAWLDIGARLRRAGLHAPEVFAVDADRGFVLMEDLGTRTYLPELNDATAAALYRPALNALLRMQRDVDPGDLPTFDASRTIPEMELLGPWFLERHLGFEPAYEEWNVIEQAFRLLADSADEQPRRFMHRDFHSRNLLVTEERSPGIVDFQGAMLGPVTYDLASLLRDCYIVWPSERVDAWVEGHRARLVEEGVTNVDAARFRRWFDLIGLQRHIKVLGIFSRLWYRDGKAGYLADLPRVFAYVLEVAGMYPQLLDFAALLQRAADGRDLAQPRAVATVAG